MREPEPGGPANLPRRGVPLPHRFFCLGLALAAAQLASFYWKTPLGPRGVTAADWLDLACTYIVLLLYAWVLLAAGAGAGGARPAASLRAPAALLLLAAVTWILGRGVHVAANSLHDWLDHTGGRDAWGLFQFWDETLGHLLEDTGTIAFAIGITWVEGAVARGRAAEGRGHAWLGAGALCYGFIFFAGGVEGGTVPLTLPWCVLYAIWAIAAGRGRLPTPGSHPARFFFLAAFVAALVLFSIWGLLHGGFPEFSATGFGP